MGKGAHNGSFLAIDEHVIKWISVSINAISYMQMQMPFPLSIASNTHIHIAFFHHSQTKLFA